MSALHPYNWLRGRALRPGGEVARRFLAPRPIVLQVGGARSKNDAPHIHGGMRKGVVYIGKCWHGAGDVRRTQKSIAYRYGMIR